MNLLKKLWDFLFGKEEEFLVLEEVAEESDLNKFYDPEEPEETAQHCNTHLRFRRHCLDCLRVVAAI